MPKFIDTHAKVPPKSHEEVEMLKAMVRDKKVDAFGTRILEGYFTESGGGHCVCEAPSAEAVMRSHEAMGLPLKRSEIQEVVGTLT
jgi:hypothetical protein